MDKSPSTLALEALAGSCDCSPSDLCLDCQKAVNWFVKGYQQAQSGTSWVSVGIRLPEKEQMVLVYCENGRIRWGMISYWDRWEVAIDGNVNIPGYKMMRNYAHASLSNTAIHMESPDYPITHWMPLPAPPTKDE